MRAHRIVALTLPLALGACAGPEASDAVVCADLIQRLCAPPVCSMVQEQLEPFADCEASLLVATGCDDPNFVFQTPTRDRFLECRAPLLREGSQVGAHPACGDVGEAFTGCPDLVAFLRGEAP